MSSEGLIPSSSGASEASGLAPCKSPDHAGHAAIPPGAEPASHNAGEASTAPAQDNGHEAKITAVSTLPVASRIQPCIREHFTVTRPVMCAAPGLPGSRSEGTPTEPGTAGGVTSEAPAKQGGEGGATVAGPGEAEQAWPAWDFVTVTNGNDAGFEDEGFGGGAGEGGGEGKEGGREDLASEGFSDDDATLAKLARQASADGVDRAALFDIIRSARALMREIAQRRKERQDTAAGDASNAQYKRQAKLLLRNSQQVPAGSNALPSLCVAIADYSASASSFYTMRRAGAWAVQDKVMKLLAQQDQLQRSGGATSAWAACVATLEVAAQLLRDVQSLTLEDARALSGAVKVPPQSKKLVLKKAEEDWLDTYFRVTAGSVQYRHAALLQGLCGMRPLELERGVTVRRHGAMLGIKILGAKVRKTAGQEWREVFIPVRRFPDWFLQDLGPGPKVYAAPRGAMRSWLKRLSPLVFPVEDREPQLILSSYVLRHALITDLRQAGWDVVEMAKVLGERRAETAKWYGLNWRGARFRRTPDIAIERGRAETARPVVQRESDFLAKKKEAKAGKKKLAGPSNR
jgi:hypothetical protein